MIRYGQFCPVAKAAEVFGDRWTPIIMRELCFARALRRPAGGRAAHIAHGAGAASQGARRRRRGAHRVKARARSSLSVDEGGEDFRPIVELLSGWGQRWGQGMIEPDDFDPECSSGNAATD